jgi:CRP/FNR family transcriptional regulator, dissimilatory nitrate respiration regulator
MADALDWARIGQALPLLAALPDALRGTVRLRSLDKGALVFRRGDRPRAMYAVLSGEARLVRTASAGFELVLQRTRNGLLAEASFDQPRYHCDAVVALPTELVSIPRPAFMAALADDVFRERWLALLLRELRRVRAQNECLSLKTAEERIIHAVEAEGSDGVLVLTQSRKDWAAELGLTHEALYRALARMTKQRRLKVEGSTVCLSW